MTRSHKGELWVLSPAEGQETWIHQMFIKAEVLLERKEWHNIKAQAGARMSHPLPQAGSGPSPPPACLQPLEPGLLPQACSFCLWTSMGARRAHAELITHRPFRITRAIFWYPQFKSWVFVVLHCLCVFVVVLTWFL